MNNSELIQEAIDHADLPGVEEWKPNTEERLRGMDTSNCIFPQHTQPWTPPLTTTSITLQPTPDFIVNVYKAENGYMVEINGKKYIAKKSKDIADLFVKQFDAE